MDGGLASRRFACGLPDTKKNVEEIRQKNFALGLFRKLPLLQVMKTD
jgi:hypothetical protein